MSGTSLELQYVDRTAPIVLALNRVRQSGQNALPVMKQIGEYLVRSTLNRFDAQVSPEGVPWQADTPAVWAKKKILKILTESSHLKGSIVYRASSSTLEWGTNKIYGGIHQRGGEIQHKEREQVLHFKKGTVDQFANKDDANRELHMTNGKVLYFKRGAGAGFHRGNMKASFAMKVTIGAHETQMPARPYLGISGDDQREILLRINDYLERAVTV